MAELFDWRTIVSRRMVFGVGRLTENRLVNDRFGTTFYCFGVELPLFLRSVFVGMTGVMGHDFGTEVARRVARHILFIEPRCCLSCKPEVPGQADYSSVTRMFLVFIECLSWGAGLCLECYGVVDVLNTCTNAH